jgi:glycosyltransferase involved in cell wall biosynthesis
VEFLFCSEAAARDYADWWGVPYDPARMRTLHNGFFLEPADHPRDTAAARAALGLPLDGPIIASVFRFDPVKQPLVWVEAAIAILAQRPDARFLLLGEGDLKPEVEARIADAGIADRFILPGLVRDVPRWLAAADLFMMTSRTEGLPNGAIEAQFAGVPVVSFDVGGVGETILADETGRLVPADDVMALADAAVRMLADPGLKEAGAAGSSQAARRFGMARYLAELGAIYG